MVKSHNTPEGRLWQKAMKDEEGLAEDYAAVGKCYQKQRAFKLEWARKKKARLQEVRTRTMGSKSTDKNVGEYHSFAVHVREEGGDAAALKACQDYLVTASKLATEGETHKGGLSSSTTSTTIGSRCCVS